MKKLQHVLRQARAEEAQQLKQKALEPHVRECQILKKKVSILVEYTDYRGPHNKGPEGAIYCENIVNCYQNNIKCRYSGISPLYPDPFLPRNEEFQDEEADREDDEDQDPSFEEEREEARA